MNGNMQQSHLIIGVVAIDTHVHDMHMSHTVVDKVFLQFKSSIKKNCRKNK